MNHVTKRTKKDCQITSYRLAEERTNINVTSAGGGEHILPKVLRPQ